MTDACTAGPRQKDLNPGVRFTDLSFAENPWDGDWRISKWGLNPVCLVLVLVLVLLKVRRSPLKIPGRREKRAEALISQWSATYTVCFYPHDLTTYLIGTEEGFIHKVTRTHSLIRLCRKLVISTVSSILCSLDPPSS